MADNYAALAHEPMAQAVNAFTMSMYETLSSGPGNLFFSPLCLQVILALVYIGATGETAEELEKALHLPHDKQLVDKWISGLMHDLKPENGLLDLANGLFLQDNFIVEKEFNETASRLLAEIKELDFGSLDPTRQKINKWTEGQTHGKIKNIIKPGYKGLLDPGTIIALVSAGNFTGAWRDPFRQEATKPAPFHLPSGRTIDAEMMYVHYRFFYADVPDLDSQALLLGYEGSTHSMMILLPKKTDGLKYLESRIRRVNILDIRKTMTQEEVYVYLPKFKLEQEMSLKDNLRELRIFSMFDRTVANFSGIGRGWMSVDEVLHKTFIEVNETGTEQSTMVLLVVGLPLPGTTNPPPVIFRADHPFVFFLLDERTRAIVFAGRVTTPIPTGSLPVLGV